MAYDEARRRLYVHSNDGLLLGFTGIPTNVVANPVVTTLSAATGNYGATPFPPLHAETWSSGPVVARDGKVYVGSSNGRVYGFEPDGFTNVLDINVGQEIEASPALGLNDDLVVVTRAVFPSGQQTGRLQPAKMVHVSLASGSMLDSWDVDAGDSADISPGCIVAPVVDRDGAAYAIEWSHRVLQVNLATGEKTRLFHGVGKLCQTPALTCGGSLLLVSSEPGGTPHVLSLIESFDVYSTVAYPDLVPADWQVLYRESDTDLNVVGGLGVYSDGRIWFADDRGALYRVDGYAPLMRPGWPTLQGGNRHLGQWATNSLQYVFAVLASFPKSTNTPVRSVVEAVHRSGRAVGSGWYDQSQPPYYYPQGVWVSAFWNGTAIRSATGYYTYDIPASVYGLNEAYDLAGVYENLAVIWPAAFPGPTLPVYLPKPAYLTATAAADINDAGLVVGWGSATGLGPVAMQWFFDENLQAWQPVTLGATNSQSWAYGVTEVGWRFGKYQTNNIVEGFVLSPNQNSLSQAKRTGTGGAVSSEVCSAVDGMGFCGNVVFAGNKSRAFLVLTNLSSFGAGGLLTNHFLPVLAGVTNASHRSAAFGANRHGAAVGWATLNNNAQRAALWLPGTTNAVDVNTLRQAGFTLTLTAAYAINDCGVMVGSCRDASNAEAGWIAWPAHLRH
jgi:hypothetical protein